MSTRNSRGRERGIATMLVVMSVMTTAPSRAQVVSGPADDLVSPIEGTAALRARSSTAKPARAARAKMGTENPARAEPTECIPERELAVDPAGHALHLGTQSYPRTLALADHEVVLTFDDGPLPDTTPRVLRALREACVHATFFLVGRQTRLHPELARKEDAEGHSVGHHSNTHPSFTLRGFDQASAEADIENGVTADETAIYGQNATPANPHVPFFRFPGFADTNALLHYLDGRGIAVFGSDLWASDWLMMTPEHERQRVLTMLEKRPRHNGIILFHDTRRSTAAMLPDLLRDLKTRGYTVAHLVYRNGATTPALTAPLTTTPETVKIIANLQKPIVFGSHHLGGESDAPSSDSNAIPDGAPR